MKRSLYSAFLTLGTVAVINLLLVIHLSSGNPQASHKYLKRYQRWMNDSGADVVLIGNSMLGKGVNHRVLSHRFGRPFLMFAKGGTASAAWYLEIKNVVLPAPRRPELVVIFFRDTFLTRPDYRTRAEYRALIRDFSVGDEPLVQELAYDRDRFDQMISALLPAYARRGRLTKRVDRVVKDSFVAAALGSRGGDVDHAIGRVFRDEQMLTAAITREQEAAETTQGDEDFERNVGTSFLPHIIGLAERENIRLIFIRVKRRRDTQGDREPPALKSYIHDLGEYLAKRNLPFIDFTHDDRIRLEHFGKGDHLNRAEGRTLFTRLVAEKLEPYLTR
jgi:hypothetical protein